MAGLRPGKDPGNGAQVAQVVGVKTPAGARSEPDALDEVHRCSLAKVGNEPRSFVDELTIEGAATGSEFPGVLLPFRNLPRLDAPEVQEMRVQHSRDELFEVSLRNGRIGIFKRDDLALFCDPQP